MATLQTVLRDYLQLISVNASSFLVSPQDFIVRLPYATLPLTS